jgi:[CysO sulfur-carrier protein]-S-L-cysteine hydrolase
VDDLKLCILQPHLDGMKAHVGALLPEEACGIVASFQGRSVKVFPVENILHSPVRFRMDPKSQLDVFDEIDEQGWELLAIYHSHPNGPEIPSETDVGEAYYPEAAHLIWSRRADIWLCRAFYIRNGKVVELSLRTDPYLE